MTPAAGRSLAAAVEGLIRAGRLERARARLAPALARRPDDPGLLYLRAVCLRRAGELPAALETLARLKALAPAHGRARQEEGHALRAMGRPSRALAAYQEACRCNPALTASRRACAELLAAAGRSREAGEERAELERLEALPPPLLAALDLLHQGRPLKAEALCRAFLRKAPHCIEAMRLLAAVGLRLGALDEAEFLLESAAALAPDDERARLDHIGVLRRRQRFDAAREQAEKLLAEAPDRLRRRSLLAVTCLQAGDCERALALFDQVLERAPGDPATLTARGHACRILGDFDAAVAACREALAGRPRHGEAWHALANLKTYRFSEAETAAMAALEADETLPLQDRIYLCFALGKAREDRGEYADSFRCYARGNALKKAQGSYRAEATGAALEAVRAGCGPALFAARAGAGCPAPDPVFIVGLPRAGSTLLEQILASHSLVDGTRELPDILSLAHRLRREARAEGLEGYGEYLARLPPGRLRRLGERYLEDTRVHRRGAPFFIDKMPNNFQHVGLIRLILPNAKIIDARRGAMACCFGAFQQLFAEGQEFSYDLADLGRYYRDYLAMMAHWDRVLPGAVLTVRHEDVVRDLEAQVRRMLAHCGLPFEPACLAFHRTRRAVRTPSSEQVRRPIYTDSLERWRRYAAQLEPLREILEAPPAPG